MASDHELYPGYQMRTFRLRLGAEPRALEAVLQLTAALDAPVGDIQSVSVAADGRVVRDVAIYFTTEAQLAQLRSALGEAAGVEVLDVVDDVLELHRGGAIETVARVRLDGVGDLRRVYTPGVASVCKHIERTPALAYDYTHIWNKVAIVTNGTAVLGLGDLGPLAALPVMEGKSAIFRRFAGLSAEPVLIDSREPKIVSETVERIHLGFGAIQLEDIAAPECFEIERRLTESLPKPVLHDDQWGTATVVLAGLINALARAGRKPADVSAAILGSGAGGIAIARTLKSFGLGDVILVDTVGAVYRGRTERMTPIKQELAAETNRDNLKGGLAEVLRGRDLFVGVSVANQVTPAMVRSMAKDPIVFALANPVSEISVADAYAAGASVAMDGRGMNNALAYPGLFRGALDARATRFTEAMRLAAARAVASCARGEELVPDMFDLDMHATVARAVGEAWRSGPTA